MVSSPACVESKGCIQDEEVTAEGDEVGGETEDQCEAPADGCQKAEGDSRVAARTRSGRSSADVMSSESESEACNDGTESATADSEVVDLRRSTSPRRAARDGSSGATRTTVDDPFSSASISVRLDLIERRLQRRRHQRRTGRFARTTSARRSASRSSRLLEEMLGAPRSRRLDVRVARAGAGRRRARVPGSDQPGLPVDPTSARTRPTRIARTTTSRRLSRPDRHERSGLPGDHGRLGRSVGRSTPTTDDNLPFTGADVGTLGLIGLGVMAIGLGLMALADRRRTTS